MTKTKIFEGKLLNGFLGLTAVLLSFSMAFAACNSPVDTGSDSGIGDQVEIFPVDPSGPKPPVTILEPEEGDPLAVKGDTTLYARQTGSQYIVTFDGRGGTPGFLKMFVTAGGTYGPLPSVSRTGYRFRGWYTDDGVWLDMVWEGAPVTTAGNHTLYARWREL